MTGGVLDGGGDATELTHPRVSICCCCCCCWWWSWGFWFSSHCSALECSSEIKSWVAWILSKKKRIWAGKKTTIISIPNFLLSIISKKSLDKSNILDDSIKADNMNNNENNNKVTEKNVLTKQLSIQPNIPAHLVLARTNSRRITSQKSVPTFPTKTLRMKSLLWTKPTGIAINSLPSTLKQVSHYWYLRSISYWCAVWKFQDFSVTKIFREIKISNIQSWTRVVLQVC